jgi:hypothetical protein
VLPSVLSSQVRRGIEDFLRSTFPMHTPYFDGVIERLPAAVTALTVPSSRPACARAAQIGWPRSAAHHPTLGLPGSTRTPAACVLPAGRTASFLAREWGGVQWPPQPRGCIPYETVAQ